MSSNCDHNSIFLKYLTERCQFVLDNCDYEYINYYSMHFCLFNSSYLLTIPISLVFLVVFFLIISGVTNSYLSPSLTKIVDKLKISQNLAGVTLIALGNGAGDVISSIVASNTDDGIELALGGLVGGGMMVTSLILGIIVYYGKVIEVNKPMFNRDIFLFIVSLLILFAFSFHKKIILLESLGFIGLYLLNVGIAFFQDWQNKKLIRLEGIERQINLFNNDNKFEEGSKRDYENKSVDDTNNTSTSTFNELNVPNLSIIDSKDKNEKEKEKKLISDENMESVITEIYNYQQRKGCYSLWNNNYQLVKNHLKQHYSIYNDEEWEETNCFSKFIYIVIKCPINSICSLTIPSCEEKHWIRIKFVFMPISISILLFIVFKAYKFLPDKSFLFVIGLFIAVLSSAICYLMTNEFPENKAILLAILSMIMSIIWIWFIANNIISLLEMIGMLFNLPAAFLGITILSFGNSICDLSLNITLVKQGYGEMAVTSSIAGPLLNLLIGLGISLVKTNIVYGDIPFNIYTKETIITAVAMVFLSINLIRLGFQGRFQNYKLNRDISYVGFALYLIFFILICIIQFI